MCHNLSQQHLIMDLILVSYRLELKIHFPELGSVDLLYVHSEWLSNMLPQ